MRNKLLSSFTSGLRKLMFAAAVTVGAFSALSSTTALAQSSNQVGFWYKASEPSWGVSIQQQGSNTFAVWYTYNAQGKPIWHTLSCSFTGSSCSGDLFTASGTPFAQMTGAAGQTATKSGTGSLQLSANNRMSLSYTIGSVTQTKSDLEPLNLVSATQAPVCTLQTGSRANASNFTDLWWGGEAASGWGVQISHQGTKAFVGWYAYGDNREATWITGLADQDPANSRRFTGTLYQVPAGTPFSQAFPNSNAASTTLGSFELFFNDGQTGTFTYVLPNVIVGSRSLPLSRFAIGSGATNLCTNPVQTSTAAKSASRFLSQASFGPNRADLDRVMTIGAQAWIEEQFNKSQTLYLPPTTEYVRAQPVDQQRGQTGFTWALWKGMATADDQLRQRLQFALSQIFVISFDPTPIGFASPRGPSQYYDQLGKHAFGNYRDLLEAVTYSPMMGIYLSSIRNQKENATTGAVPDENYAREVMQLFSIGLHELNNDGTRKLNSRGEPIETYTNADITGLAKVFTGLSWAGPDTSDRRFNRPNSVVANIDFADAEVTPMQAYNQFHSTSEKRFLGVTIPAQTTATINTNADVKVALDRLFNHPNVGPFIGHQLIQRLVKSDPSSAYVGRVAAAFNDNGRGVRGDMKAVIKAVLLDPEAQDASVTSSSGKLREPVLRFVQWMRAFNAKSADGRFLLGNLSDPATSLGQAPMRSPSVFNFFRPGYVAPNSKSGAAGLVAPELQITNETSVAGYLNYMRNAVSNGVGSVNSSNVRDIQADYAYELSLADNAQSLTDHINTMLAGGALSPATVTKIRDAVSTIAIPTTNGDAARKNRVSIAVYLTLAAPEYINQN